MRYTARTMKQIHPTKTQNVLLESLTRASTSPQGLVRRASVIIAGAQTSNQSAIAHNLGMDRSSVHLWLERWQESAGELDHLEAEHRAQRLSGPMYQRALGAILSDAPRPGHPPTITEDQKACILALAAEKPEKAGVPITHWTCNTLRDTVIDKGIVPTISRAHIGRFLKSSHAPAPPQ
jgi:transposase